MYIMINIRMTLQLIPEEKNNVNNLRVCVIIFLFEI